MKKTTDNVFEDPFGEPGLWDSFWEWIKRHADEVDQNRDAVVHFYWWGVKKHVTGFHWDKLYPAMVKNKVHSPAILACFRTALEEYRDRLEIHGEVQSMDRPPARIKAASIAMVKRHFEGNHESADDDESEVISVHTFETEPARLDMTFGLTLNLGNFESAVIRRGLSVPCYREEIPVVEKRMTEWVTTRIRNDRKRIKGGTDLIEEPDLGLSKHECVGFADDDDKSLLPGE